MALDLAISKSREALGVIHDSKIDIHRELHASKKRPREGTENVKAAANMILPSSWNNDDEDAKWYREKYETLNSSSSDGLENELKNGIQKVETAAKKVKHLEAKIRKLGEGNGENNEEVNLKLKEQRRLLSFYEMATSMVVKLEKKGDSANVTDIDEYVCTVKNAIARRAVRFSITESTSVNEVSPDDNSTVKFVPKANAELLPEYLRQSITFEREYCPVLTNDVLASLYAEEPDAE